MAAISYFWHFGGFFEYASFGEPSLLIDALFVSRMLNFNLCNLAVPQRTVAAKKSKMLCLLRTFLGDCFRSVLYLPNDRNGKIYIFHYTHFDTAQGIDTVCSETWRVKISEKEQLKCDNTVK